MLGISSGLLVSLALLFRKQGNVAANRMLGLLLLGMSFGVLQALLIYSPYIQYFSLLQAVPGIVFLSYGPLIYLYIRRSILHYPDELPKAKALHFLPMAIAIVIAIYFITTNEFKADQPVFNQLQVKKQFLSMKLIGFSISAHNLIYLFLSFRLLQRYRTYVRQTASFSNQTHFRWLLTIIGILLLPVFSTQITFLVFHGPPVRFPYPTIGFALMMLIIHILYLFKPTLFSQLPEALMVDDPEALEPVRYESSALANDQKKRIHQKLLQYMDEAHPYRKQELTLRDLADTLSVNVKYLSQVINEVQEQNFMDFINGYRINEAKDMLQNRQYQHYTIVAIAQEVGFKSRSAFYNAFKKVVGSTPTAFKKEQSNLS